MAASLTKIELKGAKVVETPASTGVAVNANGLEALIAILAAAKEIDNNVFDLAPLDTDVVVSMGNISDATVVILIPDGTITVKLDSSATALKVDTALILFGTSITTGIKASNPSATEVRQVRKYLASATT
jgi:hypothetical protein